MNKDVIKKYKKEFDWWLDGGEVLSKIQEEADWWLYTNGLWNNPTVKFVINDEYVEYRKALAEGKTIEMRHPYKEWNEVTEILAYDMFKIREYRIKPDVVEFKVGDYVVCGDTCGLVWLVMGNKINYSSTMAQHERLPSDCKLWTLKDASDDEWVLLKFNGESNYSIMQVRNAKKSSPTSQLSAVPCIGQSPAQLGLEK